MNTILFLLVIFCELYCKKVTLKPNVIYNSAIDGNYPANLTLISKSNEPFQTEIYRPDGSSLVYKSAWVNFNGYITFVEVRNLSPQKNRIKIYVNEIERDNSDIIDEIISLLSIIGCISFILEPKSRVTKGLLISLLVIEMCRQGYVYVGNRFIPNILKLK